MTRYALQVGHSWSMGPYPHTDADIAALRAEGKSVTVEGNRITISSPTTYPADWSYLDAHPITDEEQLRLDRLRCVVPTNLKIQDLLRDESCWTQDAFARDKDGKLIPWGDKKDVWARGVSWDFCGAVFRCYDHVSYRVFDKVRHYLCTGDSTFALPFRAYEKVVPCVYPTTFAVARSVIETLDI